jgi:DNA-binding transcriptional ArsR family regulator
MSKTRLESDLRRLCRNAPVFAALGDETRLSLLARLTERTPCSIARLTAGSQLTRQAITKHLQVLQGAGLVRGVRCGREMRFDLEPEALDEARQALEEISRQWDVALAKLKKFVDG